MLQLRTYTLRSAEALQRYAIVHWARHVTTFDAFGITTHGVWTDDANRLIALIRYPPGVDVDALTRDVMASPEFAADMAGFDPVEIVGVESTALYPTSFSPNDQEYAP